MSSGIWFLVLLPLCCVGERYQISSREDGHCISAAAGADPFMAPCNWNDTYQWWIKDDTWGDRKDKDGQPAIMLFNLETGKALRHGWHSVVSWGRVYLDDVQVYTTIDLLDALWTLDKVDDEFLVFRAFSETDLVLTVYRSRSLILLPLVRYMYQQWEFLGPR